jgi:hypothetical protein
LVEEQKLPLPFLTWKEKSLYKSIMVKLEDIVQLKEIAHKNQVFSSLVRGHL